MKKYICRLWRGIQNDHTFLKNDYSIFYKIKGMLRRNIEHFLKKRIYEK